MRVAICSKEGLFREGLSSLLDHQGQFQVVASEGSAHAVLATAKASEAQVLVIDQDGLTPEELQFVLGARAFGGISVILISREPVDASVQAEMPVDRVIGRQEASETLFGALRELAGTSRGSRVMVREGRRPYGTGAANDVQLSRREYEVALLVGKGMSNRKISVTTGLREQSVKNLVSVIMRKLRCENRVQVALRLTQSPMPN